MSERATLRGRATESEAFDGVRPALEVLEVSRSDEARNELGGFAIDLPRWGAQPGIHSLDVGGWVLERDSSVEAVEVVAAGRIQRRVVVDGQRPDVLERHAEAEPSACPGFSCTVGLLGQPTTFELGLRAVLEDGRRIPLGVVRGRRPRLVSSYEPRLAPILVTMLGRVGSTLLMRMLDQCPEIVVHPPHRGDPYETRVTSYWMHLLKVLAEPANHQQSSPLASFNGDLWRVGHNPFFAPPVTLDPGVRGWFDGTYPGMLAEFSQRSIDAFYERVGVAVGRTGATYFAEKSHPDHIPWLVRELYPCAREIVLVRDPRDMIASIRAFNAKRGYDSFGREDSRTDVDFVNRIATDLERLADSWRQRSRDTLLVRYEDLVLTPRQVVGRLLDYLELSSRAGAVDRVVNAAFEDTPDLSRHRTSRDPRRSIGRWVRDLDDELKAACSDAFCGLLEELGYAE